VSGHSLDEFEFKFLAKLKQRNVFRVTAAYLGLAWFIVHVATVIGETFEPVHHAVPWLIYALAVGFPVVLIGSWMAGRRPSGTALTDRMKGGLAALTQRLDVIILVVIALVILALLADRWVFHRPTNESMLILLAVMMVALLLDRLVGARATTTRTQARAAAPMQPRVAILPFVDMSEAKNQEYFCEGIAEEIINALCGVNGLRVASRSASFQLKNKAVDSREVGRLLNVQSFLEGSVRKAADRLRITAQLIKVSDGFHLWSQTFDRKVEDIFVVQEEIARRVVDALSVQLLSSDASHLKRQGTHSVAAYDFYLRGRQLLNKEKETEQRAAVELFRQAIQLDPAFAQAHAGLADVLTQLMRQRHHVSGMTAADAVAASERAIQLAPQLPDAFVARGNALQLLEDAAGAERAFERAIELDPRNFHAHYWFGKFFAARGEHAQAARHYELAFENRPDDYRPITLALQEYQALKDTDKEQSALRRSWQALERHLALDPDDSYANDHAAGVLMLLGRREEANRLLERAISLRPDDYRTLYTAACTASLGGEYERALDFLDRAVGKGRGHREWLMNDNDLAPLHEYPRFKEIVSRLT
jgi:adenylate cyclase